jgi:uncharacterized membrane-anchored protein
MQAKFKHTRIMMVALIVIGALVAATAIGNIISYRENADEIIAALLGSGVGGFIANLVRSYKQRLKGGA